MSEKEEYHRRQADQAAKREKKQSERWANKATEPLTLFTGVVAAFTIFLVIVGGLQLCILRNQLTEMRNEQRPWISIIPKIESPLTYDADGAARIMLKFTLKNVGHLPAQFVYVTTQFVPFIDQVDLISRRDQLCKDLRLRKNIPKSNGFAIMPNGSVEPFMPTAMSPSDVMRWKEAKDSIPIIVGCVDYVFVTDNTHHDVGFIFELDRSGKSPGGPFAPIRPKSGDVSQDALTLEGNPNLGWAID